MWQVVFTKQAQRDAKKLCAAGLRPKAEQLIEILHENPSFCIVIPAEAGIQVDSRSWFFWMPEQVRHDKEPWTVWFNIFFISQNLS